jgi:hypothetical protein
MVTFAASSGGSRVDICDEFTVRHPGRLQVAATLGQWRISKGASVTMKCWTEGPNVDGSKEWFKVDSHVYPYPEWYIPGNSARSQSVVDLC